MNTNQKQKDAKDKRHRLNELAKVADIVAFISSMIALIVYFCETSAHLVCALIIIGLTCGAFGLYVANSEFRIKRAAGLLLVIAIPLDLLLPFAAQHWNWKIEASLGLNILLNFSLLCTTGAIVALLRNSFGNLKYIEEHDWRSAVLLGVFLGGASYCKVLGKSFEPAAGLADLFLVIAGVVIGAIFEKERSERRHAKPVANG